MLEVRNAFLPLHKTHEARCVKKLIIRLPSLRPLLFVVMRCKIQDLGREFIEGVIDKFPFLQLLEFHTFPPHDLTQRTAFLFVVSSARGIQANRRFGVLLPRLAFAFLFVFNGKIFFQPTKRFPLLIFFSKFRQNLQCRRKCAFLWIKLSIDRVQCLHQPIELQIICFHSRVRICSLRVVDLIRQFTDLIPKLPLSSRILARFRRPPLLP